MSTCKRVQRCMPEYVDGTLSEPERSTLEAHLHDCAACRAEMESLRRSLDALDRCARHYREALNVPDMWPEVSARIRENRRRGFWSMRPVRAAAAGALALVAALALLRTGQVPERGLPQQVAKRLEAQTDNLPNPAGRLAGPRVRALPTAKRPTKVPPPPPAVRNTGGVRRERPSRLNPGPPRGHTHPRAGTKHVAPPPEPPALPAPETDGAESEPTPAGPSLLAALRDTALESVTTPASVATAGLEEISSAADLAASEVLDKLRIAALIASASYENGTGAPLDM